MEILRCKNLCVSYDSSPVIQNASFFVNDGDYILVVGENGSGKSTLIKTILGLISPSSGEMSFLGGLEKNKIGYLAQKSDIKRDFPASVFEVTLSGFCGAHTFLPFYKKAYKQRAEGELERLGIADLKTRPFSALSGGQQQRVLLARAMCATKKLILFDEPVTGLDALAAAQFYKTVEKLNKSGIAVIMVTHDIGDALPCANKIIHIGRSKVWFMEKDEYVNSEIARNLFGQIKNNEV